MNNVKGLLSILVFGLLCSCALDDSNESSNCVYTLGECNNTLSKSMEIIVAEDQNSHIANVKNADDLTIVHLNSIYRSCVGDYLIHYHVNTDTLTIDFKIDETSDYAVSTCACESSIDVELPIISKSISIVLFNNEKYLVE